MWLRGWQLQATSRISIHKAEEIGKKILGSIEGLSLLTLTLRVLQMPAVYLVETDSSSFLNRLRSDIPAYGVSLHWGRGGGSIYFQSRPFPSSLFKDMVHGIRNPITSPEIVVAFDNVVDCNPKNKHKFIGLLMEGLSSSVVLSLTEFSFDKLDNYSRTVKSCWVHSKPVCNSCVEVDLPVINGVLWQFGKLCDGNVGYGFDADVEKEDEELLQGELLSRKGAICPDVFELLRRRAASYQQVRGFGNRARNQVHGRVAASVSGSLCETGSPWHVLLCLWWSGSHCVGRKS